MNQIVLGVFFLILAGIAAGGFYVPYNGVKKWSWEVYWITGGIMSWIIAPWVMAFLLTKDPVHAITATWQVDRGAVIASYLFGMMWGIGGLSYGLAIRYLGMSLGMAVANGFCTVIGTLMPLFLKGEFTSKILATDAGRINLFGLIACALGIALAGAAGMSKEKEMSDEAKKKAIKEFNFVKGMIVATIAGVFSAGMAFAIDKATPVAFSSEHFGTETLWTGLPKLCVILLGGFTTNFIWCLYLLAKNKSFYEFTGKYQKADLIAQGVDAGSASAIEEAEKNGKLKGLRIPILANIFLSMLAGLLWYMQFFFYTMGETKMGSFKFSCWTLHMAFAFVFSSLFGLALHEWRGSSKFTKSLLMMALATLIYSTCLVGYSNFMNADAANVTTKIVAAESSDGVGSSMLVTERQLTIEQAAKTSESIKAADLEKAALKEKEESVKARLNELYPQDSPE
ncbi:MAG: L-rhamnose/proton symporter RhaT [Thermoguttaceae bacterium]|jgi:L-rhamnose-H+ transport protein